MSLIIAIATALFLFFGQGVRWYCMGGDTEAYYMEFGHHIETKPLYSLIMEGARVVFGQDRYLYAVAIFQIILSVVCITVFVNYIRKHFKLGIINTIIVWGLSLLPYVILLPEDVISHTLMTESITYPLMYIFIVLVHKGVTHRSEKEIYISVVLTIILTLVRGQMLFLLAISAIALIYIMIMKKSKWYKFIIFMIFMLICVKGESLLCGAYESYFFNAPKLSYSAQTLVQKALFCADENDEALFDTDSKEVFKRTYSKMMKQHSNYKYMTGALNDWKHTTDSFGDNSYILGDVIEDYSQENGYVFEDIFDREEVVLDYSNDITWKLIKAHPGRFLYVSLSMVPSGFVSTVLFHKESIYGLIHVFTLLFYLGMIVLSIVLYKRCDDTSVSEYVWLVLLTSIVNVFGSDLIHMGLQRYQAYTLGLNWVGAYLIVVTIVKIGYSYAKQI